VGKFFKSLYISRDLEELPSGEASLQQIFAWDTTCCGTHPNCWPSQSKPLLPTRVIDIGMGNGGCFLFESTEQYENYITVSHCWGNINILTTRRQNLKRHKEYIDLKLLPKTFQDSINITYHLGIRYLWIDSLCIIQDDPDDWAQESSKMASIYRNSYLTIAATAAKDGSEGLFKPREADTFCIEISEPQSSDQSATLRARRGRKHNCLQSMGPDDQRNEGSEPLTERAWVYQERLLSRRMLHFASDEMIWECRRTSECECGLLYQDSPKKINFELQGQTDSTSLSNRSVFEELASGKGRGTDVETQRWYQLIKTYTLLNITKDEDRLPAFSGIASTIVNAQDYMAGIRKNHTVGDLLWVTVPSTNPRRSQSYLAPTWSWTSLIGGIGYGTTNHYNSWILPNYRTWIDVIDIFTVRSTVDPFGKVKEAELRVRGYCLDARLSERDRKDLIGSSWGSHRLRMEIPSVPDMKWPYLLSIDTAEDCQMSVGCSVSLLAVQSTDTHVSLLILAEQPLFPRRFRRIGKVDISLHTQTGGKVTFVSLEDILDRSKAQPTHLVII
jgi:Heterokaryon incompatibility protein (HET)